MATETKRMMKKLFYTIFLLAAVLLQAQCLQVQSGTYTGQTENGSLDKYGSSESQIERLENGDLYFHDFSAGFIQACGFEPISLTISIDCNGNIPSKVFDSKFGQVRIVSGKYDGISSKITLKWEIPDNQVNEVSTFILNN